MVERKVMIFNIAENHVSENYNVLLTRISGVEGIFYFAQTGKSRFMPNTKITKT
jgi:hypothetical protein